VYEFQGLIFRCAAHWPEAVSLVVFGAGLLYTLQGFRFARFLLPVTCAGGGMLLGAIAAGSVGLPVALAFLPGAALGIVALLRFRVAVLLSSTFTFGALGQYLALQMGAQPSMSLIFGGAGLLFGLGLIWASRRTLPIIVTMIQGAGLLVVGFVGLAAGLVPSLGLTFIDWAARLPLMIPLLMAMLCALGYSVQMNAYQGDIESGGRPGLRDLEAS
jgi:hypothetical protein